MAHHTLPDFITTTGHVQTPEYAIWVVAECVYGRLRLVTRLLSQQEAEYWVRDQAVFAFRHDSVDQWLDYLSWGPKTSDGFFEIFHVRDPRRAHQARLAKKIASVEMLGSVYKVVSYYQVSSSGGSSGIPLRNNLDKYFAQCEDFMWRVWEQMRQVATGHKP